MTLPIATIAVMRLSGPSPLPPAVCEAKGEQLRTWGSRLASKHFDGSVSLADELANVPLDKGNVTAPLLLVLKRNEIWTDDEHRFSFTDSERSDEPLAGFLMQAVAEQKRDPILARAERPSITLFITREVPWRNVARALNVLSRAGIQRVDFAVIRTAPEPPPGVSTFDAWVVSHRCGEVSRVDEPSPAGLLELALPTCSPSRLMLATSQHQCHPRPLEEDTVVNAVSMSFRKCDCAVDEQRLRALLWNYYRRDIDAERPSYSVRVGGRAELAREGASARLLSFRSKASWESVAASFLQTLENQPEQPIRAGEE